MDESKRSAFDVYRQQQVENEGDSEEVSEDCSVAVPRKRKISQGRSSAKKRRDDEGAADRVSCSRREQLKNKLFGKRSLRASKSQKARKEMFREATKSYVIHEDKADTEESPVEPVSKQSPFQRQFYMEEYKERREDSRDAGRLLFELMVAPYSVDKFFSEVWEKKPLALTRSCHRYNDGWFSSGEMDEVLRERVLEYSVNINIASYKDGKRLTHNPVGRAYASTVWEFFREGCSVQLLNPQTYSDAMWLLESVLQELFGSFVGANIYLTPAGTQGFAPHYDDIEAFVIQVEGQKQWRLYQPKSSSEILPRSSSDNLSPEEIGQPILDIILEPGDLLYFPRGIIHQATALPDTHSLHITLSAAQRNTWGDMLEKLLPAALQAAIEEDVDFRRSLPIDYLQYMGVANYDFDTSQTEDSRRKEFMKKLEDLFDRIIQYARVDAAVDQMAAEHIHSCLPPLVTKAERKLGVWEKGSCWRDGRVQSGVEITGDSQVKLVRHGALRLVVEEENGPVVYYTTNNARVYRAKDPQCFTVEAEESPAVEYLLSSYPDYVDVASLPVESEEEVDKVALCKNLFSKGLLLVK